MIEQKIGNFLTNSAPDPARINRNEFVSQNRSPKRGRVKENIKNIEIKLTMTKPKKITLK